MAYSVDIQKLASEALASVEEAQSVKVASDVSEAKELNTEIGIQIKAAAEYIRNHSLDEVTNQDVHDLLKNAGLVGGTLGGAGGAVAGGLIGGPLGVLAGGYLGAKAGSRVGDFVGGEPDVSTETQPIKNAGLVGGTIGGVGGALAGGAVGGPLGALAGGYLGAKAGSGVGDSVNSRNWALGGGVGGAMQGMGKRLASNVSPQTQPKMGSSDLGNELRKLAHQVRSHGDSARVTRMHKAAHMLNAGVALSHLIGEAK